MSDATDYEIQTSDGVSDSTNLNLDHNEARALHRIVRAMHDGECPKCHSVHNAKDMRVLAATGWRCPNCAFHITKAEADEVFRIFAPFMESNLAIFEKWRNRSQQ